MTTTNGFQDTEIGPLPLDWHVGRIGEIAQVKGGYSFPPEYQGQAVGPVPFYKVSDMNLPTNTVVMSDANNYISHDTVEALRARLFPEDTVIFPKVGGAIHTNKKRVLSKPSLIDNNVMGVTVEEPDHCRPDFLYYYFLTVNLTDIAKVGPLPSITGSQVKGLGIPLPPLPEQRRIAHVLSTVQSAIAAQDNVITAARELKKSLLGRVFAHGVDATELPSEETEVGTLVADWPTRRLEELTTVVRGGSPRPKGDPRYFSATGTIPWIKISDLSKYRRGKHLTNTEESLTEAGREKSRYLEKGTLVLTNSGTVGIPAILGMPGCIHDGYLAFLDFDEGLQQLYLYYYFQFVRGHLMRIAPRGTQPNLNTLIAKALLTPLPTLTEQQRIVETLTAADDKVQTTEDRKAALEALFRSILHNLMTGRIRTHDLERPA